MLDDRNLTQRLQEVKGLRIVPYERCKLVIGTRSDLARTFAGPESVLCTHDEKKALMRHNPGAGIVIRNRYRKKYLAAVFACSPGTLRQMQEVPSVSTKVFKHLDWIRQITGIGP